MLFPEVAMPISQDICKLAKTRAATARLLVTMPLYYRPERLIYFAEMIRTLADFPIERLTALVLTNARSVDQIKVLTDIVRPYNSEHRSFQIVSCADLHEQYELC